LWPSVFAKPDVGAFYGFTTGTANTEMGLNGIKEEFVIWPGAAPAEK
jgi:hypothetical protein